MRYFYDEHGEQQVIGHIEDYCYFNAKGTSITKLKLDIIRDIGEELHLSQGLHCLGIPVDTVFLVMDHELRRPKQMDIPENFLKSQEYMRQIAAYLQELSEDTGLSITVKSSLSYFGDPSISTMFNKVTRAIRGGEPDNYGFTLKTFEHTIDDEFVRNSRDLERSKYYRSREFARLCREFDIGEAYFHTIRICQIADDQHLLGVLLRVPKEAQLDKQLFELGEKTIVYS